MTEIQESQTPHSATEQSSRGIFNLTRRGFLQLSGLVVAALAGTGIAARSKAPIPSAPTNNAPIPDQYPQVPYAPVEPPPANILSFFTPHEAITVEAMTARILPGTPDDPGAREAGVVNFIDK